MFNAKYDYLKTEFSTRQILKGIHQELKSLVYFLKSIFSRNWNFSTRTWQKLKNRL